MLFFCGFWCCSLFKTILWVAEAAAGVETVECTSDWYSYLSFGEVITAQPFISSLPSPQYHHHHRWLLIGCEDGRQITRWHSSTLNTKPLTGQFGQIQENSDKSWQIGANPGKLGQIEANGSDALPEYSQELLICLLYTGAGAQRGADYTDYARLQPLLSSPRRWWSWCWWWSLSWWL